MKDIKVLYVSKVSQENDITTNIVKENANIFSNFIYQSFNNMIIVRILVTSLKLANITHVFKKGQQIQREIINL